MKNIIKWVIFAIIIVGATIFIYNSCTKQNDDSVRFCTEYTKLSKDNVFIYKNMDEILELLDSGTGIVYFGFPECKWCQSYVVYLNQIAKDTGITEIYYYNILEDRKNNTENYQKIVNKLKDYLFDDQNGNKKVMVPDVTIIKNGEIIGHNNETSNISNGEPEEYWTEEKINALKENLKPKFSEISNVCVTCN